MTTEAPIDVGALAAKAVASTNGTSDAVKVASSEMTINPSDGTLVTRGGGDQVLCDSYVTAQSKHR